MHVTLVQFANYQDLLTKYLAGLSTKDLPDLFQPEDTTVQRMIDSQSVMPVQACVDADHYSLAKLLPRATAYFSYQQGALRHAVEPLEPGPLVQQDRVREGRPRPEQAAADARAGEGVLAEDRVERRGRSTASRSGSSRTSSSS